MPKVSIGLPVYNGENYVSFAIECVLRQTYSDWELVISDNGSTDRTAEICSAYAQHDARIRFFRVEENQGAAWNFNRVFELASGEYFRWLSHDDYMLPELLQVCVPVMDASPEIAVCATATGALDPEGFRIMDASGDSDLACQGLNQEQERLRKQLSQSPLPSKRFRGILLYSRRCNEIYGLVRREMMAQTQLHPVYCGGEKVLLAEFALRGIVHEVPDMLFYVRWHTERFTSSSSTKEQEEHMQPTVRRTFALPHQYRATLGYLQLLAARGLSGADRVRCFFVWMRFTLQLNKWKSILVNTFRGRSTWAEIEGATSRGERVHENVLRFGPEPSAEPLPTTSSS